ncbi:MAG: ATP-binding protein, partial [Allobaculum sp.]|nr:ATP-binding protein [Allobaculum sp.]
IRSSFIKSITHKFLEYFGVIENFHDTFEVKFYTSVERNYYILLRKGDKKKLNINFSKNYWVIFEDKAKRLLSELKQSNRQKTSNYLLQTRIRHMVVNKISEFANDLFCDDKETIFFPSGRCLITMMNNQLSEILQRSYILPQSDSNVFSNIVRRSIDLTLIREYVGYMYSIKSRMSSFGPEELPLIFRHHISKILKGQYVNEDGKERIYYDDKHFIPLNLASSGQQDVINILLDAIDIYRGNLLANRIIEEPETHLFPNAQRFLVEILVALSNFCKCSYVITTHSPFVLASFNNILYYNKVSKTKKEGKYTEYFGAKDFADELEKAFNLGVTEFKAYNLRMDHETYCTPMLDNVTGLIGANVLDESTESIYDIFSRIYDFSFE